jgi:transcriptional regulator with XRE-family HTH domain
VDGAQSDNPLGEFLRARRELVRPEDVGLRSIGRRRVAGLRREEVALLAGVSQAYYLRLEQGRDRNPSVQVLQALSEALQLDAEGIAYMSDLVRERPRRVAPVLEGVPAGIAMLLPALAVPAFVLNRYRDVLASNALAVALSPHLAVGTNRLMALFTDPVARDYHPDWEQNTASVVAQLRAEVGSDIDDPRFQALVGELSLKSDRFRQLWARHDVSMTGSGPSVMFNPRVGELRLRREKLTIEGPEALMLVIYHAEPGSASANALRELAG